MINEQELIEVMAEAAYTNKETARIMLIALCKALPNTPTWRAKVSIDEYPVRIEDKPDAQRALDLYNKLKAIGGSDE